MNKKRKRRWNLWRDERGIAFPLLMAFIPVILVSTVFAFDLTKVLLFRHQLQSIADSLSLAGASAKTVQPIIGTGYTVTGYEDSTHQPEYGGAAPAIVGYTPVLDPVGAEREAESAYLKNEMLMEQMSHDGETITNWSGQVENDTKFSVTVSGEIQPVLWAKVQKMMGNPDGGTLTIHVKSTAGIQVVP